ncbi:MAG TPA: hypothetical protein VK923_06640 [Euzebyales bacterium]|nr:hypothetical protein [Euzebyales bacterium]
MTAETPTPRWAGAHPHPQIPTDRLAGAGPHPQIPTPRPAGARPHSQRAPRLRPDQHLADSITRVGRFAAIDPLKGRSLPKLVRVLGVVAWVALTVESFRRARASASGDTARD